MRTKHSLLICLATAVLFVASCSSTTVVARDERVAAAASSGDSGDVAGAEETPTEEPTAAPADDDDDDDASTDDDDSEVVAEDVQDADDEEAVDLEEAEGFGLGGAEQIESLVQDCEADSDLACDILFQLSDFDSPEEDAALTCGGRSETTVVFCTEGIDNDGDSLAFDVDSDGLAAVVTLCVDDADMTACDFLYYRSPLESEFEEIGETCGGRVPVAVPDCRTFLTE